MRKKPDLRKKTSLQPRLYPGIKDPLYVYIFLHLIIKCLRYRDIDYSGKYKIKENVNRRTYPTGILTASLITYKLLNHQGKCISYRDIESILRKFLSEIKISENQLNKMGTEVRDVLRIDKDGMIFGVSNIIQISLLNDRYFKKQKKKVESHNAFFLIMRGHTKRQSLQKKIKNVLNKKFYPSLKKFSLGILGKQIVFNMFKKIITSLIPSGFSEQEVLKHFLYMIEYLIKKDLGDQNPKLLLLNTIGIEKKYFLSNKNVLWKKWIDIDSKYVVISEEGLLDLEEQNKLYLETRKLTLFLFKSYGYLIEKHLFS